MCCPPRGLGAWARKTSTTAVRSWAEESTTAPFTPSFFRRHRPRAIAARARPLQRLSRARVVLIRSSARPTVGCFEPAAPLRSHGSRPPSSRGRSRKRGRLSKAQARPAARTTSSSAVGRRISGRAASRTPACHDPAPIEPTRRQCAALVALFGRVLNDQYRRLVRVVVSLANDAQRLVGEMDRLTRTSWVQRCRAVTAPPACRLPSPT